MRLREERIERMLGVAIERSEVEAILGSLGFQPVADRSGWSVQTVSHRLDVEREIDLIEEVARIHGFEKIPATLPPLGLEPTPEKGLHEDSKMRASVRSLGYDETIGFSFSSSSDAEQIGTGAAVRLRNPLSQRWEVMRNSAVPTMLRALEWNLKRNQTSVRLAEFGRTYERSGEGYREPRVLTLGVSGEVRPVSWSEPTRPVGFYDLKADVTELLHPFARTGLQFVTEGVPKHYREGHAAAVRSNGKVLAHLGQLDPRVARKRKIRQPLFIAEIWLDTVYALGLRPPGYLELPKVPAVIRDFSLLVPEGVQFQAIIDAVGAMPDLESLAPIEIFRGKNVPQGRYSLLLRASWQRLEESLTDDEVNAFADRLRSALESKLGIKPRV